MAESDDLASIRRSALRMLTRRDHSQKELALKLKTKGFDSAGIRTVMENLQRAGLINEQRFCENYIHWRRARGYGPTRISMELQARGVASDLIAELIEITDNAWFTEIRKIWQKQFKGKQPSDYQAQAKQMRFLQYRGFTREQINSVLKNRLED